MSNWNKNKKWFKSLMKANVIKRLFVSPSLVQHTGLGSSEPRPPRHWNNSPLFHPDIRSPEWLQHHWHRKRCPSQNPRELLRRRILAGKYRNRIRVVWRRGLMKSRVIQPIHLSYVVTYMIYVCIYLYLQTVVASGFVQWSSQTGPKNPLRLIANTLP